jgi:RNA polymerase sigma-70 factor (ECF subfamily)
VQEELRYFEQTVLPHLPAAYNLARWLTRNEQDAEDLVQEAYLRAFKYFKSFRRQNSHTWILQIVRNTFYSQIAQNRLQGTVTILEDEDYEDSSEAFNPERLVLQNINYQLLKEALLALPVEFREVTVLRELEELSYKDIAELTGLPIGTVMSRLARARKQLQQKLSDYRNGEKVVDL